MESDIYGNTALPLAPDLQSLQTPHIYPRHSSQGGGLPLCSEAVGVVKTQVVERVWSSSVYVSLYQSANIDTFRKFYTFQTFFAGA